MLNRPQESLAAHYPNMNVHSAFVTFALVAFAATARALPPEPKFDLLVPLLPENVSLGFFPFEAKPIATVKSGAIVKINGGGGARWSDADPAAWLKENHLPDTPAGTPAIAETIAALQGGRRALDPAAKPGSPPPAGHMLVGPIAIAGAEPGDSIEIRILDVRPRISYGTVSTIPGKGGIPDLVPRPFSQIVRYDLARDVAIYEPGVEVPLRPFMGVMGMQPGDAERPLRRSSAPGSFGGNLDLKELVAGSTLYLPVFQPGGLFYTGDSHGGQGDGEVTVSAIESANSCILQFILHKGKTLKGPRAETRSHFIAIGLDPDLNLAMRNAILETNSYLREINGYDFFKAFTLSSIGVDFHVTQVVDGTLGIHGMIPKAIFTQKKFPYWNGPN